MRRQTNSPMLFIIVALVTIVLMGAGAVLQHEHFHDASAAPAWEPAVGPYGVVVRRVPQLPLDDPFDDAWNDVAGADVALLPQNITMPQIDEVSVPKVRVQSLTDGRRIAWRMTWTDQSPDRNVDAGRFCDAVAIQFPLDEGAPMTMGLLGMQVQILHWKALWQADVDRHYQDVQDLHPNYWSDLYWFAQPVADAEATHRYRVPDSFQSPESRQYFVANASDNPVTRFQRRQPVEELVAEGFGTLTTQPINASRARGDWRDGQWAVVIVRPLITDDPLDRRFTPGSIGQFALAVWEGQSGNVGGRKQYSNWTLFEIEP